MTQEEIEIFQVAYRILDRMTKWYHGIEHELKIDDNDIKAIEVAKIAIQSLQTETYFWEKCPYYVPDIMFDGEEEHDYGQCKYKESHYQIKDELIRKYDALFVLDGDEKGQECIRQLPPVNQQIIRCKDCKHRDPEDKKCDCGCWHFPFVTKDDDFCSYAEAKMEEGE